MERPGHWRLGPLREWGPLGERRLGTDGRERAVFDLLVQVPPGLNELVAVSRRSPPAWLKLWGLSRPEGRLAFASEHAPGIDARKLCELLRASGQSLPAYVAVDVARAITDAFFDSPGALYLTPDRLRLTWSGEVRLEHNLNARAGWGEFPRHLGAEQLATLPPEIIRGLPGDARTAVYSAAVLLLMLLSRGTPFRAETSFGLLDKVVDGLRDTPEEVWNRLPSGLGAVLERALSVELDRRFDHPLQLRERLAPFAGRPHETRTWLEQQLPRLAPWDFSRHQLTIDLLEGRETEPLPKELEQALLSRPDDEAAWAVLADHLLAKGSPRGELAEVQRRLESPAAAGRAELEAHEKQLRESDARLEPPAPLRCLFRRGYVRVLEVGPDADLSALEEAMVHPSFRFLHTVKVTQLRLAEPALAVLVSAKHPAVRRLELPVGLLVDEQALRAALPRLEAIVSHG